MEFYFPPKEKSVVLLQAEEKLAAKGYAFSKVPFIYYFSTLHFGEIFMLDLIIRVVLL